MMLESGNLTGGYGQARHYARITSTRMMIDRQGERRSVERFDVERVFVERVFVERVFVERVFVERVFVEKLSPWTNFSVERSPQRREASRRDSLHGENSRG
jgi:hypothetical protein